MFTDAKNFLLRKMEPWQTRSLDRAAAEQDFTGLREKLAGIVPDLSHQYSSRLIIGPYMIQKVRTLHAFQISLVEQVLANYKEATVVDVGDSSGTHIQYLKGLHSQNGKQLKFLSVNLDAQAIDRIRKKGLEALHLRAEELASQQIHADIFMSFETLEHLMNPCQFLHDLSTKTKARHLVLTVPYVEKSRMGLRHLRRKEPGTHTAEDTHIFELSPLDWKLLFQFSGWKVEHEKIFYQYPSRHWLRLIKAYWKRIDFEGFYGVILTPDHTWSSKYKDW